MRYFIGEGHPDAPDDQPWAVCTTDNTTPTFYASREEAQQALAALARTFQDDPDDEYTEIPFETDLMWEGVETGDGRMLVDGDHRELPLPWMLQTETAWGHDGAVIAGRLEDITFGGPGGLVTGRGMFLANEDGARAADLAGTMSLRGVSVDVGDIEDVEEEVRETDDDGFPTDVLYKFIGFKIMGATQTPFPAFANAQVRIVGADAPEEDEEEPVEDDEEDESVAAAIVAALPARAPAAWFTNPALDAPTPLTVGDDGRVYGHIATWGTCHTGSPQSCVTPPQGSDYRYFLTGEVETDEGRVPVGQLTLAGGHADLGANWMAAKRHYDDTNSAVCDVTCGEDDHGIWVSGALRPGVSQEEVSALMASAPSGDWRRIAGKFELVAVCAVNSPGFPVARVAGAHLVDGKPEGGEPVALVAAAAPLRDGQKLTTRCGCSTRVGHALHRGVEAGINQRMAHIEKSLRDQIRGLAELSRRS